MPRSERRKAIERLARQAEQQGLYDKFVGTSTERIPSGDGEPEKLYAEDFESEAR